MSVPVWVARRSVAAAIPLPTSVANLCIWLDASDLSTLSTSNTATVAPTATGQTIFRWTSKVLMPVSGQAPRAFVLGKGTGTPLFQYSADGRHAVQMWNRVTNNADQLRSTQYFAPPPTPATLPAGTSAGWTCIHVVRRTIASVSQGYGLNTLGGSPNQRQRWLEVNTASVAVASITGTAAASTLTVSGMQGSPNGQRAISNAALDYVETSQNYSTNTLSCFVGISTTVPKTVAVTALQWTNGNSWDLGTNYNSPGCNIAEVLYYNRTLTDAEKTTIKAYLTAKWGL